MARYAGTRRGERRKLNRSASFKGGALSFAWTANQALARVIRHVQRDLERLDKRTNPNQNLVAAVKRLELLRRELIR